jgi:hypothetical protein
MIQRSGDVVDWTKWARRLDTDTGLTPMSSLCVVSVMRASVFSLQTSPFRTEPSSHFCHAQVPLSEISLEGLGCGEI